MSEGINRHDHRVRRCPMLGHDIPFSYCRAPGSKLPCRKICDCWWETFNVEAFIRAHYSEAEIKEILVPRRDKMLTIVEMIEKAKKAAKPPRQE